MIEVSTAGRGTFDVQAVREDFPILRERVHGRPLIYLDNAATTQKPAAVIDRLTRFYMHENANVHRGVHLLSERATDAFEQARRTVAGFLNAESTREIVFVRGTTEAINNLVKRVKRVAFGIVNFRNYRIRALLYAGRPNWDLLDTLTPP